MNTHFWSKKKVLITGHTGFKGSWLSLWLNTLGADVCGLALSPNTQPNLFDLLELENSVKSYFVDIRDASAIEKVVKNFNPEIVIHMAAQPLVRYSYLNPVETYETNVMGTVHVFEALKKVMPRVIVCVTTDKCYQNNEWVWGYRESDRLGGLDPYSNSKACAELVSESYRHSYFADKNVFLATARSGNVLGGGDWSEDRLVPDLVRAKNQGEKIFIRSPGAIRPWQHVLDPLAGYLLLAEKLYTEGKKFSEAWNFGPELNNTRCVGEVVKSIALRWGLEYEFGSERLELHEAMSLRLDIEKSRRGLGWTPRWSFDRTIRETIAWYDAYFHSENMRDFSLSQINSYHATQGLNLSE